MGWARQGGEVVQGWPGKVGGAFLWPTPARSTGGGGGGERRLFQREWNEEDWGLLIGATGEARRERTSRIPEVRISLSMAKEGHVHVRKEIEEEEDLVGPV